MNIHPYAHPRSLTLFRGNASYKAKLEKHPKVLLPYNRFNQYLKLKPTKAVRPIKM